MTYKTCSEQHRKKHGARREHAVAPSKQKKKKKPGGAGEGLIETAAGGEDEKSDIQVAEDGELAGFFDETGATLRETNLTAALVFDPLYLNLSSPHFCSS